MIFKIAVRKNLAKLILVMEFSFIEVGDCNFTIKEFHQRCFPSEFSYRLMRFYQYSESNYSTFPITLRQLPCRSNNDLAYKRTPFPISRSEVFFVKFFGQKKVEVS